MDRIRKISSRWGTVIGRAALYFLIPFLAIVGDKLGPFAEKDVWPSTIKLLVILILATAAGLVAVRAFFDGSVQRHVDELKRSDTNPPFRT